MTHAALQDLLPCPFCGSAAVTLWPPTCEKDSEYNPADRAFPIVRCGCGVEAPGENWDHKGSSAVAAWNRRAALSAMDGEAVDPIDLASWLYRKLVSFSKKDYDSPRVVMDLRMACGSLAKLYTAPPPQQAEQDTDMMAECMIECREGLIATGIIEASVPPMFVAEAVIAKFRSLTHPTPSPGPQGGDAALIDAANLYADKFDAEDHADILNAFYQGAGWCAKNSTPPQPEAQVSDAMVERAAFALSGVNKNQWEYDALLRKRHIAAARTALTAALTTSGRDGDG